MSADETPAMLRPARLRLLLGLAVALGGAVAAVVVLAAGWGTIASAFSRLSASTLLGCAALLVGSWLGEGVAFAALARLRGVRGLARAIAAYVGGGFPGLVTPFGAGALPGWAFALAREGLGAGEAAAVLGARGLVTSLLFVLAGGAAALLLPARLAGSSSASWAAFAGLAVLFAAVVFAVARPLVVGAACARALASRPALRVLGPARAQRLADAVRREAGRFADALRDLVRRRPASLAAAVAGILVSRACLLAILPVLLRGLGWSGGSAPVLATVVGIWALASGSPTPGGSGAVEAATTAALTTIAPLGLAAPAALIWRGLTYYVEILVGWPLFARYLAMRPRSTDPGRTDGRPARNA